MRRKELSLFFFLLFIGSSIFSQNTKPAFSQLDVFELEHASDPQISPDGNTVVFVRNRMDIMKDQRMGDLWLLNADGTNHHKLTSEERRESSPRWSPSGDRIAFVAPTKEGAEIFIHWTETGQQARLTQLPVHPGESPGHPTAIGLPFRCWCQKKSRSLRVHRLSQKEPNGRLLRKSLPG